MYQERRKSISGPLVPALIMVFFLLLSIAVYDAARPVELLWAYQLTILVLTAAGVYFIYRYFTVEHEYAIMVNEIIFRRGKGIRTVCVMHIHAEDVLLICRRRDPAARKYKAGVTQNCASTIRGRFRGGWLLFYKDGAKVRRALFEPSGEYLRALVKIAGVPVNGLD